MGGQPVFYDKPVALTKERHRSLRIDPEAGYRFASHANSVGVSTVEFKKAAWEYPIVFRKENGNVYPIVVLALGQDINLFVSEDGRWLADYVPAYVRRYPFILASQNRGESFAVCIDETFAGFNTERGEPLFLEDGSESPFLSKAIGFLKEYQQQHERTREFSENLRALNLLEPMQANVSLNSGRRFSMAGFMVVNNDRLQALEPERLSGLIKTGQLELIYLHLFSLSRFSGMVDRVSEVLGKREEVAHSG